MPVSKYTPTATGLLCDTASVLLCTSPGLYPPTVLSELFSIYDVDGDGVLSQSEYNDFCNTTEAGAGCDDTRWAAHKQTMEVPDGLDFLTLRCFSKLYQDKRMAKHYGQEQRDLERSKEMMEKLAKAKEKAAVVRSHIGSSLSTQRGPGNSRAFLTLVSACSPAHCPTDLGIQKGQECWCCWCCWWWGGEKK